MDRKKVLFVFCILAAATVMSTSIVFADSSWTWISETRPYDVLPFVAAATILIESVMVCWLGKVRKKPFAVVVVLISNLISFMLPYLLGLADAVYPGTEVWDRMPFYTVSFLYLLLTLAAEVPVGYILLKKHADNGKRLLRTLIAANVVTTVMVAVVERTVCEGHW